MTELEVWIICTSLWTLLWVLIENIRARNTEKNRKIHLLISEDHKIVSWYIKLNNKVHRFYIRHQPAGYMTRVTRKLFIQDILADKIFDRKRELYDFLTENYKIDFTKEIW